MLQGQLPLPPAESSAPAPLILEDALDRLRLLRRSEAYPCSAAEFPPVEYGGLGKDSWARLLAGPSLPVRLFALRALSTMGPDGARALLAHPLRTDGQAFPWMWAVLRSLGPGETLPPAPAFTPQAWVRSLARRQPHPWRTRRTRAYCTQAMADAEHPLHILTCAVRLLELHGEAAIPSLLEVLRTRPDEHSECAAWALGTLGSAIVPELLDAWQGASRRVRGHLAMALWYLGPRASKALPVLLDDPSPQASAALPAMEGAACEGLVARGRGPVWLDVKGVQALARLAFGDEEKGRVFAAAGLGCYGPAAASGLPILEHLARDPKTRVRLTVAHSLSWGERRDALDIVLLLTEDPEESVRTAATQTLGTLFESVIPARQALLDRVVQGQPEVRKPAAVQLARIGLPPDRQDEVSELLEQSPPALLPYLLEAADICGGIGFHRQPVLALVDQDRGPEARCAVVRTLAPFLDTQGFARLRELLFDEEEEVSALAARMLARKGMARLDLGERLLQVPPPALRELLNALHRVGYPGGVQADECLPLLAHLDPEIQALAARALERLAGTDGVTPEVVLAVTTLLESPHEAVVMAASRTLLEFGLEEVGYEAIESLLGHADPRISRPCALLLGRRGLRGLGDRLLRIPGPTLRLLLGAAIDANFPATDESDLLLLLQHCDNAVVRTAADALAAWAGALRTLAVPGSPDGAVIVQEPRPATPQLLEGLRTLLESPDSLTRVAGARALVHLGCHDVLWVLLESLADRDWVFPRLQATETIPEGLLEALAQGRCIDAGILDLIKSRQTPEQCAEVLTGALINSSPEDAPLVRTALASLGLAGLDVVPELLGHLAPESRRQALLLLEQLLFTNLDTYVEWVAERGLVLPLDHPDLATQVQLHVILAGFINYAKAWRSRRFLPLLAVLSRSPSRRAARLALGSLAHQAEPQALELIQEAARTHPAHEVRLAAMRHLRWSVPLEGRRALALKVATWPPDPTPGVELQRLALLYRALGLEEAPLRWALQRLDGPDDDSLFLPSSSGQFVQLVGLLNEEEVGATALRLLLGHPGRVSRAAWVALVRALPSSPHADALVRKWPRLVVSLLKTPDGTARVAQLGSAAHAGLRLALARKGYRFRLRAVAAAPGALSEDLARLAESDPHPEVRAAARLRTTAAE